MSNNIMRLQSGGILLDISSSLILSSSNLAGSSSILKQNDYTSSVFTGGVSYTTKYTLVPKTYGDLTNGSIAFTSINPSVMSVSDSGVCDYVTSGTASIKVSIGDTFKYIRLNSSYSTSSSTSYTLTNYTTSSLARHISDQIDSRISNLSKSGSLFTVFSSPFQYNQNFYAYDVDFTCRSQWNSDDGFRRGGTLISPKHVLFAVHYSITVGATLRFIDRDNQEVYRIVSGIVTHPLYNTPVGMFMHDVQIAVLSEDVPSSISFCKILPSNYSNYLPSISSIYTIPTIIFNQYAEGTVRDLVYLGETMSYIRSSNINQDIRTNYYKPIISGDSGQPNFVLINGAPILIGLNTYANSGGTYVTTQKSAINTMMTQLGGGYQLTEVDLSMFSTYV